MCKLYWNKADINFFSPDWEKENLEEKNSKVMPGRNIYKEIILFYEVLYREVLDLRQI